jgi:hypothetical protein
VADTTQIPGQIPVLINDTFATNITNFSPRRTQASQIYTGFLGNFGKSYGVPQYSFTMQMPPRVDKGGWQFNPAVLARPFTLSFRIGSQEYRLTGCTVNDADLSVAMKEGNVGSNMAGTAMKCDPPF